MESLSLQEFVKIEPKDFSLNAEPELVNNIKEELSEDPYTKADYMLTEEIKTESTNEFSSMDVGLDTPDLIKIEEIENEEDSEEIEIEGASQEAEVSDFIKSEEIDIKDDEKEERCNMPRPKSKNPGIGKTSSENMRKAIYAYMRGGLSKRAVALKYNIPLSTFRVHLERCEHNRHYIDLTSDKFEVVPRLPPNDAAIHIFSRADEEPLSEFLQTMAKLRHGLNIKSARKLAFDWAVANKKKIPLSWRANKTAGMIWFKGFMKRNIEISFQSAVKSLGGTKGFNRPGAIQFFENLKVIYERFNLTPSQIYNVNETALIFVQDYGKVLAIKGQKEVENLVSSERETLITMCGAINAIGNAVPPFLVFPRRYFKNDMIKNSPRGTQSVTSASGGLTSELFVQWMRHFIRHAMTTVAAPVLLIMDNPESHICLETISLADENYIILLTLPPLTSHRLQPLDKCGNGPLKNHYHQECQNWIKRNPGKTITIYDVAEIIHDAYPLAFCHENAVSAFQATGIFPYNDQILNDAGFVAASVTDETPGKNNNSSLSPGDETPVKPLASPERLNSCPEVHSVPLKRKRQKKD